MSAQDALRRILSALAGAGIPSMLTGSFAGAVHGAPRASQDIDLVVTADGARLRALALSLPPEDFLFDLDHALSAWRSGTQLNIVDYATGWKVDIIFCKPRTFSREEFSRRVRSHWHGLDIDVASVEDLVLSKLEWAKLGQSARQIEDVAHLLAANPELDLAHVDRWLDELDVRPQWDEARRLAGLPLRP